MRVTLFSVEASQRALNASSRSNIIQTDFRDFSSQTSFLPSWALSSAFSRSISFIDQARKREREKRNFFSHDFSFFFTFLLHSEFNARESEIPLDGPRPMAARDSRRIHIILRLSLLSLGSVLCIILERILLMLNSLVS